MSFMDSNCAIAGRRRAESLITGDVFCFCAEMRGEGDMSVNKHVHTHTNMSALPIQPYAQNRCGVPQCVPKNDGMGSGFKNPINYIM